MPNESQRFAQACVEQGVALGESGQLVAALRCFDSALQSDPQSASAHANRGNALLALDCAADALHSLERALTIAPNDPSTWSNRGVALHRLGAYARAAESFAQALHIAPDSAQAHCNCGLSWLEMGQPERAIDHYQHALVLQPDLAEARWNRGIARLQLGDYAQGWSDYEARWNTRAYQADRHQWPWPQWDGRAALQGKHLLLTHEQGLGDTVQFCRFTGLLAARGARITLCVQAGLERLLRTLPGVVDCGTEVPEGAEFDFHCPMLSLPLALGIDGANLPLWQPHANAVGYLQADPGLAGHWRTHLDAHAKTPFHGPRVGLVWRGNPQHPHDDRRSLPLTTLLAALPSGPHYIALQIDLNAEEARALRQAGITDCMGMLGDFADTAALCDTLDCVVSVDTAVAHLAGALGRPTCLLLPAVADWRWQLQRPDSPWYPSMQLLRQSSAGDWSSVLQALRQRLQALP